MKKRGTIVIKVYNSNAGKSGGPQVKIPQGKEKGFLERSQATVSEKAVKGTAKSHAATYAALPEVHFRPSSLIS